MSLHVGPAIFGPSIAGNPFYLGWGGNWWVLKVKFPTGPATYCENHLNWKASSGLSVRWERIWEQCCALAGTERGSHFNCVLLSEQLQTGAKVISTVVFYLQNELLSHWTDRTSASLELYFIAVTKRTVWAVVHNFTFVLNVFLMSWFLMVGLW